MKQSSHSKFVKLGLVSFLAAAPVFATASPAEQDQRAISGTIACGGNHFNRLGGTEVQRTSYVWRNYNSSLAINIDRLALYDATGAVIVDYDASTLPVSRNNVIGGGDNTIEPFQTVQYRTLELVGAALPQNRRPIQAIIEWSADSRALIPEMVWVRNSRRQETIIDDQGNETVRLREERARHLNNCRSIEINKGHRRGRDRDHEDD